MHTRMEKIDVLMHKHIHLTKFCAERKKTRKCLLMYSYCQNMFSNVIRSLKMIRISYLLVRCGVLRCRFSFLPKKKKNKEQCRHSFTKNKIEKIKKAAKT